MESDLEQNTEQNEDQQPKQSVLREIISWVLTILVAVLVARFITQVLIINAVVPSGSMENTIMTGDRIVANRLAYLTHDPERFDVVVFPFPDDESQQFVKRVIGLPGDTVIVKDGKVFINGEQIDDSQYVANSPSGVPSGDFGPFEVPPESYFMLGDNRNISKDSRFWEDKFVDREKISGKAIFEYYPQIKLIH